jgi:hypothetical protein
LTDCFDIEWASEGLKERSDAAELKRGLRFPADQTALGMDVPCEAAVYAGSRCGALGDGSTGMIKRRVFISVPNDARLNERRRNLVHAVIKSISEAGFEPQRFSYAGLPASMAWSFQTVDEVMRMCVGAVIFALPRWKMSDNPDDHRAFATEYNHYEGAVAYTLKLPTLIFVERGVNEAGIALLGGGLPFFSRVRTRRGVGRRRRTIVPGKCTRAG